LRTNDAVSSISRLMDLGVQPFLIGSTLLGVMAQRLVRRICPHCAESFAIEAEELRGYGLPVTETGSLTLQRGKGCQQCRGTGYLGRCGIFEVFPVSEAVRKHVCHSASEAELRQIARQEGMTLLREDAWQKVKQGVTTYGEVLRVAGNGTIDA
jgi:general secretion pathway protein E